jgi:hypothetical protein
LDILVRPEHYYPAATLLLDHGFALSDVNRRRLASEKASYQLVLLSPCGVPVELHRSLAEPEQYFCDVAGLLEQAQTFSFGESAMKGLGTDDLLFHLCLHLGKRHFATAEKKNLFDIALLLQKKTVNWPDFIRRARTAGCRIIGYYVLLAVRHQHKAVIPSAVLDALRPGPWRRRQLDKYLDTAAFPIYRFINSQPGWRERMVNLLLLDRFSTMIQSLLRFAGRGALNWVLRVEPIQRIWLKQYPLGKWIAEQEVGK